MSDDRRPEPPEDVVDSGAQRAVGERRRRRLAERAGQVDLDATMSHWPVTDPPTSPRPVVRPARPTLDGVATAPVLPPPGQLVVAPLLEARRVGTITGSSTPPAGGRRSRLRAEATPVESGGGAGSGLGAATIVPGDRSAPQDAAPDRSSDVARTGTPVPGRRGAARSAPLPAPTPTPVRPDGVDGGVGGARGGSGLRGPAGARLSWPPGRREVALAAAVLAVVLLVVVLLVLVASQDTDDQAQGEAAAFATGVLEDAFQVDSEAVVDPEPTPGDHP